jgi:hypothetical protein
MTSKLVVNTIEADTGISSVSFASSISMSSTSVFHFSDAGVNIGADTNISRLGNGILGFKINGAEKFRIDSSGHIKAVGVCTATHFYGDGSNLTGITGTTINGNTNNYVVTATGTANTLQGEANLTFDGTTFKVQAAAPALEISGTNSNGGNSSLHFNANANHWVLEADNYTQQNLFSIKSGTTSSSTPRLSINPNGGVGINTSNFSGQLNNEVGLAVHGSSNDNCRISITTPTKTNSRIGYFGLSNRFGMDVHYGLEVRDAEASYATRFKIDNNGYVTMNQPYGYVRFNTISDTGGENRQTNVNTHTVQNGMSHSGGRLTVPATGKYYIGIHGNILDNNAAAQYLYINGSKQAGWRWQQNDSTQYWKSSMVGGVIALSANDYLDIYVVGQQDNHSWNMWTVYMLG